MELTGIIEELVEERDLIANAIQSLEGLLYGTKATVALVVSEGRTRAGHPVGSMSFVKPRSNRGRKFMDGPARQEVSERMKRYWARRREMGVVAASVEAKPLAMSAAA